MNIVPSLFSQARIAISLSLGLHVTSCVFVNKIYE